MRIESPNRPLTITDGSYIVLDHVIRFTRPADAERDEENWDVTIEALSIDKLNTTAGPPHERERTVFRRIVSE